MNRYPGPSHGSAVHYDTEADSSPSRRPALWPGSRGNPQWAVAALLLLLVGASALQGQRREFDVSPGGTLELDLETGGSVKVTGWGSNTAQVDAELSGRDRDDVELSFDQRGDRLVVRSRMRTERRRTEASANFVVQVPHRFSVVIDSSGGNIELHDLDGSFTGRTMGGQIDLSDLTGDVDLVTLGGNIEVADSEVDGRVSTNGGNVDIRNVVGNLDGKSMGGNVRYADSRGARRGSDVVKVHTMGGRIEVPEALAGAELHTMGGPIRVGRAAGFVKAKTMGGSIEVEEIDGWLELMTMGGDVTAVMVGDPSSGRRDVDIVSMGGDIHLVVPQGLEMEISIELEFTRSHEGRHQIVSDFPVQIETSPEWSRQKGSARKTMTATGRIGSGAAKVTIRTVNGDVRLEKR
ncbi:MAG: hypothetical protein DWQ30_24195 [Acidobacteria bacterium]|nr:MAG: hypothetical protein DWQ30_24195 [Acidobacteriota bacterium]